MNCIHQVDITKQIKKSIPYEKWLEESPSIERISKVSQDQLVLDYLISEGYSEAAEQFSLESGIGIDISKSKLMKHKNQFRELLYSGKIDELIENLKGIDENMFDNNENLLIDLLLIKFSLIVKSGKIQDAINMGKQELATYMTNDKYSEKIDQYLVMLAFQDITKYPYQDLINNVQLCKITSKINAELNKKKDPKLLMLLRLLYWSQDNLSDHVNFPSLTEPSEAKVTMNYNEKIDMLRTNHIPRVLRGDQLNQEEQSSAFDEEEDLLSENYESDET